MNKALKILQDRGFINACTNIDALSDLMDKEKISFYCGVDPTGPSLHVGHIVPFFASRHLQKEGYKPVLLAGGGTGLIGDPSGKTEMRKILPKETIEDNIRRITKQLGKVVKLENKDPKDGEAVVMNNADWLLGLNYIDFLREVGVYFSVNRMLTFEGVKQRLERGLSFIEFNYQLLQSYDFKMLYDKKNVRLQIGGADQWGNIVAGIDLIQKMGGEECYGLTFNLIMRSDGKKMGKSENGAVFLDPELYSPYDFYQYFRNVTDDDVIRFMKLFTFMSLDEIKEYEDPKRNINDAKSRLAYEVTKIIHGEEEAEKAKDASLSLFASASLNKDNIPTISLPKSLIESGIGILDLVTKSTLSPSNGESRRLTTQGGVEVNGKKILDPKTILTSSDGDEDGEFLVKVGKKKFMRIKFD